MQHTDYEDIDQEAVEMIAEASEGDALIPIFHIVRAPDDDGLKFYSLCAFMVGEDDQVAEHFHLSMRIYETPHLIIGMIYDLLRDNTVLADNIIIEEYDEDYKIVKTELISINEVSVSKIEEILEVHEDVQYH